MSYNVEEAALLTSKSDGVTVEEVTVEEEAVAALEDVNVAVTDDACDDGSEAEQGDGTRVGPLPLEGWNGAQW